MNYHLVLQFAANSIADFDRLVSLETKLAEGLGDVDIVDGRDFGSGKFNIFVLTNEPTATFTQAHQIILMKVFLTKSDPLTARRAVRIMSASGLCRWWNSAVGSV